MSRIENEKKLLSQMIRLYCRCKLKAEVMPEAYAELLTYAHRRLDACRFGEGKPTCKRCTVHCYGRAKREDIRRVMRWCGPRMMLYHPLAAWRHLFDLHR